MTPEGKVKNLVRKGLEKLTTDHFLVYRFMPVQNGMGSPGLDFYCSINGQFVAIETKVPGKKLTPRQLETASQIVASGACVFVIRDSVDMNDMVDVIKGGGLYDDGMLHDKLHPFIVVTGALSPIPKKG